MSRPRAVRRCGRSSPKIWGMRKICAKMVERLLNDGQKERRVLVCQVILKEVETETDMLSRVVTGDESWILELDSLTKRQSLEWKSASSPRPKKVTLFNSKIKVMRIVFFDVYGIVHTESCHRAKLLTRTFTKASCDV